MNRRSPVLFSTDRDTFGRGIQVFAQGNDVVLKRRHYIRFWIGGGPKQLARLQERYWCFNSRGGRRRYNQLVIWIRGLRRLTNRDHLFALKFRGELLRSRQCLPYLLR